MISVQELHCAPVLESVSLTLDAGEVLALVGSQGSGKTSLLQVLAGQRPFTRGSATVGGVDCRRPEARRLVGVAGEHWGLFPRLTVWENLQFFAGLWRLPEHRAAEVARATDLQLLMHTRAEQLRPGEAARLRLARALLHDPPALLLDEPIGDVDRESASIIAFAIGEAADRGKAILLATFGHPRTLELATRVAYLEGGRLIAPPEPEPAPPPPGPAPRHIAARRGDRVRLFAPEEIHYAYAQEKSVLIQTAEGPCAVNFTLTELEDRLAGQGFYRCHRGYLVNLARVREIASWTRDSYSLILGDGKELPLSKHRAHELKHRLGW